VPDRLFCLSIAYIIVITGIYFVMLDGLLEENFKMGKNVSLNNR